jgi:hypothetical protein
MSHGRTPRIQQYLLECGATTRVERAWPGRVNPLSSRNHRATATREARVTSISSCAVAVAASNDVAGRAWYLGPLRVRDIRFSPERAFKCIKLSSSAIPARCDTHMRPPGQDSGSGRLQTRTSLA